MKYYTHQGSFSPVKRKKPELITVRKYAQMLLEHDWFYMNSDDQRVWTRGNNAEAELKRIAGYSDTFNEMFKKIWDDKYNKI
jgi:hypothetical protein